jgi:hypothetical protein
MSAECVDEGGKANAFLSEDQSIEFAFSMVGCTDSKTLTPDQRGSLPHPAVRLKVIVRVVESIM